MQVFFQSVEVLSKGCQNITTLSFSVISGVITLTNLLNNNDFWLVSQECYISHFLIKQPVLLYINCLPIGWPKKIGKGGRKW